MDNLVLPPGMIASTKQEAQRLSWHVRAGDALLIAYRSGSGWSLWDMPTSRGDLHHRATNLRIRPANDPSSTFGCNLERWIEHNVLLRLTPELSAAAIMLIMHDALAPLDRLCRSIIEANTTVLEPVSDNLTEEAT